MQRKWKTYIKTEHSKQKLNNWKKTEMAQICRNQAVSVFAHKRVVEKYRFLYKITKKRKTFDIPSWTR